jgi:hypothetical protein
MENTVLRKFILGWNSDLSSPLSGPGINIKTGDYLLAVNGVPLNTEKICILILLKQQEDKLHFL